MNNNIWHSVSFGRITPDDFLVVVEIKKGSKKKYELDKETGLLILDRILYTSTHYPANYGFIPRTYAEDNDPLDALVLASEDIDSLALVRCYPIGVVRMRDSGENDDKIICVPFKDPNFNHITSLDQLALHQLEEIKHFFKVYKELENKHTSELAIMSAHEAKRIIAESRKRYRAEFPDKS